MRLGLALGRPLAATGKELKDQEDRWEQGHALVHAATGKELKGFLKRLTKPAPIRSLQQLGKN